MHFSQDDCRYVAGFFDGEGCIHVALTKNKPDRWRPSVSLRLTVVNNNQDVIQWFASVFNSGFITSTRHNHPRWKESHRWVISYGKAHQFLQSIYPYLIVKKKQAEIALTLYGSDDHFSFNGPTEEEYARRLSIRDRVNAMNGGRFH